MLLSFYTLFANFYYELNKFQKNENVTKQHVTKALLCTLELAIGFFLSTPYLGSAIQHPSDQLVVCTSMSDRWNNEVVFKNDAPRSPQL